MSLIDSLPRVRAPKLPRADGLIPWIVPLAIILIWQLACVTGFVLGAGAAGAERRRAGGMEARCCPANLRATSGSASGAPASAS